MPRSRILVPAVLGGLMVVLQTAAPAGAQAVATPAPTAQPGAASPDQVTLVIKGGERPFLHLALPALAIAPELTGTFAAAAHELEGTLRDDLAAARIFEIQGPQELAVLKLIGTAEKDNELYRSLGNEVLLLGEIKQDGDRLVLEGKLVDLPSGQSILGKRYRGGVELARRIAHSFADEIVLHFSGRRGGALTAIAFSSDRDGDKEIYMMDYDGRNQRRVTAHKSISMSPAWSPSGDAIAYVSFFGGDGPALYLAEVASGRKQPVITSGSLNASPSFSPDGQKIAFARSLGSNIEIFVCQRDGGGLKQLTYSAGIDTNPAWSPSGKEIAFTSSRGTGRPQIYVMDADGANLRRITFSGDYNDGAAWSPDGTRLAYAGRREPSNGFDIVVSDLVSLAAKTLVTGPGSHEHPSFSPDGRFVAFAASRGGHTQIHVVPVDGGPERELTKDGDNLAPDWSSYLE